MTYKTVTWLHWELCFIIISEGPSEQSGPLGYKAKDLLAG